MSRRDVIAVGLLSIATLGLTASPFAFAQLDRSGIDFSGSRLDGNDVRTTGLNGVGFGNPRTPGLNSGNQKAPILIIQKAKDLEPPTEPDIEVPPQLLDEEENKN